MHSQALRVALRRAILELRQEDSVGLVPHEVETCSGVQYVSHDKF
jgi:hypothetical protein